MARADDATLKALYDNHRWFELRELISKQKAPIFYQGVVACAFNDLRRCEKILARVWRAAPTSEESMEARRTLASAYFTHGKYRRALAEVDAILKIKPADSDAVSGRPVLGVLAEYPDQEIARRHVTVKLHDGGLPFSINGVQATYWFDTGAELSVMTESEASRFGLKSHPTALSVGDVNGTQVSTRIVVADELSIGTVHLRHVAFLVLPDEQPPFNQQSPGSRGLIGLPVLLALENIKWGADDTFEIGGASIGTPSERSSAHSVDHAGMCFDGNHPVVQLDHAGRTLDFALDTGASNTDLYPPFTEAFPELIRGAAKTDSYKMEGVGGAKYMDAATLESVEFKIGGFPVTLKPAGVLLKPTTNASKFFAGNLGIDLLQQAHKTTFDFRKMILVLQ
ncbi:MAG TPA: pepsin/retropepsin-like aspartic protease family protein [Candidatus Solibacter sp.]|nr:pepsin/retropepsin-like aspartic protease family protein [Candidatus Solibacter sp.]